MANYFGEDEDDLTQVPYENPVSPLAPKPEAPADQSQPMNPMVKDYLMNKFNPTGQDRLAAALAGIGTGFQGGNAVAATMSSLNNAKNQKIQDVGLQKDFEANDPNSRQSKVVQDTIKKLYADKFSDEQLKNVTAADSHLILKPLELKSKLDEAHSNMLLKNEFARQSLNEKAQKNMAVTDDKDAKALDKHLSQGWAGRSGQAGQIQGKINSAQAAEALLEQAKMQPGGLDSRQIEELSQSTAKLLGGGGSQASGRVEALVPHTMFGRAQSMREFLTNNPTGQGMQKFTDRLAETIRREKELAQNQQRQYQIEGLAQHARLKRNNPELFNQILESKGINPEMIDEHGRYKAKAAAPEPGSYPKTVRNGSKTAVVSSPDEEKEANAEGFQ